LTSSFRLDNDTALFELTSSAAIHFLFHRDIEFSSCPEIVSLYSNNLSLQLYPVARQTCLVTQEAELYELNDFHIYGKSQRCANGSTGRRAMEAYQKKEGRVTIDDFSVGKIPKPKREKSASVQSIEGAKDPTFRWHRSVGTQQLLNFPLHNNIGSRSTAPQAKLLTLQRTHGNRFVSRRIQEEGLESGASHVTQEVEHTIERTRGGGQPLDKVFKKNAGAALGADFSGVRVHTGAEADGLNRSLQARAFTTGKDIYFRHGEYNPGNPSGRELLAHELTHVVQQGASPIQPKAREGENETGCGGCVAGSVMRHLQKKLTVGAPNDIYEQEADDMANAYMNWERQSSSANNTKSSLQRQVVEEEEEDQKMQMKADSSRLFKQVEEDKEEVSLRRT
jgi:hypothetical protein